MRPLRVANRATIRGLAYALATFEVEKYIYLNFAHYRVTLLLMRLVIVVITNNFRGFPAFHFACYYDRLSVKTTGLQFEDGAGVYLPRVSELYDVPGLQVLLFVKTWSYEKRNTLKYFYTDYSYNVTCSA